MSPQIKISKKYRCQFEIDQTSDLVQVATLGQTWVRVSHFSIYMYKPISLVHGSKQAQSSYKFGKLWKLIIMSILAHDTPKSETIRPVAKYHPSIWGDQFLNYNMDMVHT